MLSPSARAASCAASSSTRDAIAHVLVVQVAAALDRKERLLGQLRSMNDEAEKTGPDGQKMQPSDTFRQAYADVVMQLKQVTILTP